MNKAPDLALRKIDVKTWSSAVAKQYGIKSLPHFKLFTPAGQVEAEGFEVYKTILAWKPRATPKEEPGKKDEPGKGTAKQPPAKTDPQQVRQVSLKPGEALDLKKHLTPGKYTVFELYVSTEPTYWKTRGKLETVVRAAPELYLRRVNLGPKLADSAIAAEHKLDKPVFHILFHPDGTEARRGADLGAKLLQWQSLREELKKEKEGAPKEPEKKEPEKKEPEKKDEGKKEEGKKEGE